MEAEEKAVDLFNKVLSKDMIKPGLSEEELNIKIHSLAYEMFGITQYWHKRIVRAGRNTIYPYRDNPENLIIKDDDILFFDFGPVFQDWEADLGRTYVIGSDPRKIKLIEDIESCWLLGKSYYDSNLNVTGAELYAFVKRLAIERSWEFGGEHCGHLIGKFPHEKIKGDKIQNYIHPKNYSKMKAPNKSGANQNWILEIHFVDYELEIGGFYEQLLTVP